MWGTSVSNSSRSSMVPLWAPNILNPKVHKSLFWKSDWDQLETGLPFITQQFPFSYTIKKLYQKATERPPIGWSLYLVILIDQPKLACFCIYIWWKTTVTIGRHSQDIKSRLVIDIVKFWRVALSVPPDKAKKCCVDRCEKVLRRPLRKELEDLSIFLSFV